MEGKNAGNEWDEEIRAPRFDLSGGAVCLDFINTLDNRPTEQPKELLASYLDLARFGQETGVLDPIQVERIFKNCYAAEEQAVRALARAVELREALYAIFYHVTQKHVTQKNVTQKEEAPVGALQTLNACLRTAGDRRLLAEKNGHFLWTSLDRFSWEAVLWPIARSAADLLVSDRLGFVRTCSSASCQWFFLDSSKNHRRRWCNMKVCGNRAKVQRFHARQKKSKA